GWFNDQIAIFQRGWDKVISDMQGWINDQIVIFQRGLDKVISDIDSQFDTQWANVTGWVDEQLAKAFEATIGAIFRGIEKGADEEKKRRDK
ncbi:unnamed protein product, partial [marine sediment metagenome]